MPIRRSLTAAAVAALTVTGVGATAGTAAAAPPAGSAMGTYIVTLAPDERAGAGGRPRSRGSVAGSSTSTRPRMHGYAVRLPERPGRRG